MDEVVERVDLTLQRVRTLLHTAPLHELEANKAYREGWDRFDTRYLQLRAFELVLEKMSEGDGAERSTVVSELARLVGEMDPLSDRDQRHQVAQQVVAWLLNEIGPNPTFQNEYLMPTEDGWRRGPSDVKLMREDQRGDEILIKLTPAGINILLGALSMDVADEQRARERLLDEEIQRGRYDRALLLATQARILSIQYEEELAEVVKMARVDVRRLDWANRVARRMREALEHVADRLRTESEITAHLLMARGNASEEQAATLDELARVLDDCTNRHLRLEGRLMESSEVFLVEQERAFHGPGSLATVNFGTEVLDPLLMLPARRALEVCEGFFTLLIGPEPPRMLDLHHLLDDLFAPRRELGDDDPLAIEEYELAEAEPDGGFSPDDVERVRALLQEVGESPVLFSDLLAEARRRHPSDAAGVLELLRFAALWACAPDQEPPRWMPRDLVAMPGSARLDDAYFGGDDLLLWRVAEAEAVSG
jgi:hypothetical protein